MSTQKKLKMDNTVRQLRTKYKHRITNSLLKSPKMTKNSGVYVNDGKLLVKAFKALNKTLIKEY